MSSKNELQEFLQQHGLPFPLYYQLSKSGEAHSPSFVCEVRVKWKDGQELAETGEGRKKREAEQLAAKKMLRSIKNIESEGHAASPECVSGGGDTCSDDHPVPSPSHVKSELQRVLQKYGFPLPKYTPLPSKGPSHRPSLSVKLTIMSQENSIVWEEIGEGRTKKEAEVYVAARALQYVKEETRVGLFHPSLLGSRQRSPVREGVEEETCEDIDATLRHYDPNFIVKEVKETGVWLCMGLTSNRGTNHLQGCVASHGQGDTKEEARIMAKLNLIQNINSLRQGKRL